MRQMEEGLDSKDEEIKFLKRELEKEREKKSSIRQGFQTILKEREDLIKHLKEQLERKDEEIEQLKGDEEFSGSDSEYVNEEGEETPRAQSRLSCAEELSNSIYGIPLILSKEEFDEFEDLFFKPSKS